MKICVAVSEESAEDAVKSAVSAASKGADMAEIRFDSLKSLPEDLSIFADVPIPMIATLRTADQGGRCILPDSSRLEFLRKCTEYFQYADIEYGSSIKGEKVDAVKIVSQHDFSKTPSSSEIVNLVEELQKYGDIAKAAFTVNSLKDVSSILTASEKLAGRWILIGMGELGEITRVCSEAFGSEITYASLEKGKETAPGQVDAETLKRLKGHPVIAGVIGDPVAHSRSPQMHNAAFESLGINGRYMRFRCAADELPDIMNMIRKLGMVGINVTIPHKQAVIPYLDELHPTAQAAGAVNCILNKDGRLTGFNTDIAGFRESFRAAGESVKGKNALIIGAGGAARACAAFLSQDGAHIQIMNRTHEKAVKLAEEFGGKAVNEIGSCDVIVNCTPLGMQGFQNESPYSDDIFHPGQAVMDAVPVPKITAFLEQAQRNGAAVISGREMLIYQAIDAFRIWTGQDAEYSVMSEAYGE